MKITLPQAVKNCLMSLELPKILFQSRKQKAMKEEENFQGRGRGGASLPHFLKIKKKEIKLKKIQYSVNPQFTGINNSISGFEWS